MANYSSALYTTLPESSALKGNWMTSWPSIYSPMHKCKLSVQKLQRRVETDELEERHRNALKTPTFRCCGGAITCLPDEIGCFQVLFHSLSSGDVYDFFKRGKGTLLRDMSADQYC